MTHIEKMKQWLEAMEMLARYENPETKIQVRKPKDGGLIVTMYPHKVATDAADTLRQAIAEVEAEKVEYAYTCVECDYLSWANNFSCECQVPPLMKFKRVKVIREST
jgi:hypothetical protein